MSNIITNEILNARSNTLLCTTETLHVEYKFLGLWDGFVYLATKSCGATDSIRFPFPSVSHKFTEGETIICAFERESKWTTKVVLVNLIKK